MAVPEISAVICTWNRAESLRSTLHAMSRLRVADVDWELVVVNNNSTDHTDRVIAEFSGVLPLIRVFEGNPGLSNARNAAVARARGAYLIWTDDDVNVDPNWLAAYWKGFRDFPEAAVFGGRVVPEFEGGRQPNIRDAWHLLSSVYAERELGAEICALPVGGKGWPYGANYAIRTEEQRRHPYDPRLGFAGGQLVGGEEIAVMERILAEGGKGYWLPDSVVYHRIEASRQSPRYLRRYFLGEGMKLAMASEALVEGAGCPLWLYRLWIEAEVRWRLQRLWLPVSHWMHSFVVAAQTRGQIDHCRRRPGR